MKSTFLSEYRQLGGDYERDVEMDISNEYQDTAVEWDENDNVGDERLEVINPYDSIDTSGDDLRHLYASVLWYLACVRSIEALNALTIDVRRYGRKKWILKQLSLWKTLVSLLCLMIVLHILQCVYMQPPIDCQQELIQLFPPNEKSLSLDMRAIKIHEHSLEAAKARKNDLEEVDEDIWNIIMNKNHKGCSQDPSSQLSSDSSRVPPKLNSRDTYHQFLKEFREKQISFKKPSTTQQESYSAQKKETDFDEDKDNGELLDDSTVESSQGYSEYDDDSIVYEEENGADARYDTKTVYLSMEKLRRIQTLWKRTPYEDRESDFYRASIKSFASSTSSLLALELLPNHTYAEWEQLQSFVSNGLHQILFIVSKHNLSSATFTDIRTHIEKLNEDMLESQNLGCTVAKMIQRTLNCLQEDCRCFETFCKRFVQYRQTEPDRFLLFDPSEGVQSERLSVNSDRSESNSTSSDDGLYLGEGMGNLNFGTVDDTDGDLSAIKKGTSLDKRKQNQNGDNDDKAQKNPKCTKPKRIISPATGSFSGGGICKSR